MIRRRAAFVALACATIAVGLVVHLRGTALAPRARLAIRSAAAYVVCAGVEVSQLYHTPTLDAVRATMLGHLVLGSGFDPRDLVAYAVGVGLAALLESTLAPKAVERSYAGAERSS